MMSFRSSRARLQPVAVAALVVALACVVVSCGGSKDGNGSATGGTDGGPADGRHVADPANCPVDALDTTEGPVHISVWHGYDALTKQAVEAIAEDYNASQSKVVVSVEAQGYPPELLKKYSDRLAAPESLPDVVFAQDTNLRFLIDSGTVVAAEDCMAADPDSSDFYAGLAPVVRSNYTVSDVLWPSAFGAVIPLLFVNENHLERAGLDPSTSIETLADLRSVAESIKAADLPKVEMPVVMMLDSQYFENWVSGAGTYIVDQDNGHDGLAKEAQFDNETTRTVFEYLQGMARDGLLRAIPYAGNVNHYLAFGNQSSSILIGISRAVTSAVALATNSVSDLGVDATAADLQLEGLEVGIRPFPGLTAGGQASMNGSAGYLVAGQDPIRVAAAWDFLRYFNSDVAQARWTMMGSMLPVTESIQKSPDLVDYFADDPSGKLLAMATEQMNSIPANVVGPVIGPYDRFRDGLNALQSEIINNGAAVGGSLAAFNEEFQTMLDEYRAEVGG